MKKLTARGETKVISDWAKETGLSAALIRRRMERGETGDEVLRPADPSKQRNQPVTMITAHGETLSIQEWADRRSMDATTIRRRLREGQRGEEAVRPKTHPGGPVRGKKYKKGWVYVPDNPLRHAKWV